MTEIKMQGGKYWIPVTTWTELDQIFFKFKFNRPLLEEIKAMEGARWNPTRKLWHVKMSERNQFQIDFLTGKNPYKHYDKPLIEYQSNRSLYPHQLHMTRHILTFRHCILAAEMGCIAGETIIPINKGGAGQKHTIRELYNRWTGGWWRDGDVSVKSLCGEYLQLNRLVAVLDKGYQRTVKVTLESGKSIILTPDHEIAVANGGFVAAEKLQGEPVLTNGRWTDKDGYIRVGGLKNQHPRWTTGGVYEHILIMEEAIGRYIRVDEVVHHKNGIRHDNRLENLELMASSSDHARLHGPESYTNFGRGNLLPCLDRVVSIEDAGVQSVYDLVCADPYRNFVANGVIVHNCGKSLAAIEAIEEIKRKDVWWVGPKSALAAVELELRKWRAKIVPTLMSYDRLKSTMENWPKGIKAPSVIIYDESSRCKSPTAQRSLAAAKLAQAVRWDHRDNGGGYVVEMTGTPAPKSPVDFWMQCEIACPGFIKEGTSEKFRRRLGLITNKEALTGGTYPHLVTWLDDTNKCAKCGLLESNANHDPQQLIFMETTTDYHPFEPSTNEVSYLYERMKGLVLVYFKKDCFSSDSRLLTADGPMTFKEAAKKGRQRLYVLTDRGYEWIDCEIKSFGFQKTYPLQFGDGFSCRTTKGHRWLTVDRGKIEKRHRHTYELLPGKTQLPLSPMELPERTDEYWEGYAHGFVFGDGHNYQNNPGDPPQSKVALFGHDRDLKPLLLRYGDLSYQFVDWRYVDVICNLPKHWKQLPINPSKAYACGFVLGLGQADGSMGTQFAISQANHGELETIQDFAIHAGLRVMPIRMARRDSPFDGSEKPLWMFGIQTYNLTKEHFLRKDYQNQLQIRGRSTATTVKWIDYEAERYEEVFCAVVPHWQNFTLANGVNCLNCLSLPDKQYRVVECPPKSETLNAAKLIAASSPSAITALTLLRELSDGFQYQTKEIGEKDCGFCQSTGMVVGPVFTGEGIEGRPEAVAIMEDEEIDPQHKQQLLMEMGVGYSELEMSCPSCSGAGKLPITAREAVQVPCPKEDQLINDLDLHDEDGRLVVYGGFTGTIDRIVRVAERANWQWIRVDGRGWACSFGVNKATDMLERFQDPAKLVPKILFIGQPSSAGMGLTLTASCEIIYYSNDFNAESRIQSEDRCHRIGMDINRGCMITDYQHLPTDAKILSNLQAKRRLQDMSLGQLQMALKPT